MLRDNAKHYYSDKSLNCAESTLHLINDQYKLGLTDEDVKLVGAFGGGCGCGNICGALAAAVAAIGKMKIKTCAHDTEGLGDLTAGYVEEFKKALGSTNCCDIKETHMHPETRCLGTVEIAADTFEKYAKEKLL